MRYWCFPPADGVKRVLPSSATLIVPGSDSLKYFSCGRTACSATAIVVEGASYGIVLCARYASATGLAGAAAANSLSILPPGNGNASPTSGPAAIICPGHSANTLFAAAMSACIAASGPPAGYAPAATQRYRTFLLTQPFASGFASTLARLVAGPAMMTIAF